jgi:hypothetical protein
VTKGGEELAGGGGRCLITNIILKESSGVKVQFQPDRNEGEKRREVRHF